MAREDHIFARASTLFSLLIHCVAGHAPVCRSKGDENISVMVTHAKPESRERPTGRTGLDGYGGQPAAYLLSGMRYAVQIASQRLLANASGSERFPLRPVAPSRPPAIALAFYSGIGNILAENEAFQNLSGNLRLLNLLKYISYFVLHPLKRNFG
jgi:hypothetical protein